MREGGGHGLVWASSQSPPPIIQPRHPSIGQDKTAPDSTPACPHVPPDFQAELSRTPKPIPPVAHSWLTLTLCIRSCDTHGPMPARSECYARCCPTRTRNREPLIHRPPHLNRTGTSPCAYEKLGVGCCVTYTFALVDCCLPDCLDLQHLVGHWQLSKAAACISWLYLYQVRSTSSHPSQQCLLDFAV